VRGRLLGVKPLPSLREVFAEVRREESRKRVMLPAGDPSAGSTLITTKKEEFPKDKPWCEYCNKPYHTKETCWKLHGKPANWKPKNRREKERPAYTTSVATSPTPKKGISMILTSDQMQMLQKLLDSQLTKDPDISTASTSASLVQRGNLKYSLTARSVNGKGWIIDTGASNHMTRSKLFFEKFQPQNKELTVLMADGSMSTVKGHGSICVAGLKLKTVLYVPSLTCNLLSISKLTRDMDCTVTFLPSRCVFQDRTSGKMIGSAEEKNELYWISENLSPSNQFILRLSFTVHSNSNILLWHNRLGHPNFSYLKRLYPNLFFNKEGVVLKCESCILAKQTHSTYQPHSYSPSKPFYLIHSDI